MSFKIIEKSINFEFKMTVKLQRLFLCYIIVLILYNSNDFCVFFLVSIFFHVTKSFIILQDIVENNRAINRIITNNF